MKIGARGKLFATSIGLVLIVLVTSGLYLERSLRQSLTRQAERQLEDLAQLARVSLARAVPQSAALEPLAEELGREAGVRITIISPSGVVLGDSAADASALDNHASRPEVSEAWRAGIGRSSRYSTTGNIEYLYVAIPLLLESGTYIVRVARPISELRRTLEQLRQFLLLTAALALGAAIVLAAVASHWLSRTLRALVASARALASGEAKLPLDVTSADELAGIAGSLNQMAEDVQRTVEASAAERARLAAVLEGMGEALIAIDRELVITLSNPAAVALLELGESSGRSLVEVVRAPALLDHIRSGSEMATEVDLVIGSRQRRVSARVNRQAAGGHVIVMHDVTELRRLETIRKDFVANVSHELRTPVSIISANAETLLGGALAEREVSKTLVGAIARSADRLSRILGDLLDLSRIEAGRYHIELGSLSVLEAVKRASEPLMKRFAESGIVLDIDIEPELVVLADPNALHQILTNYLDNARQYIAQGQRVEVGASPHGESRVVIRVADDGPGIESRHVARIFERFYRVDPGRSRDAGGTGLGLSIVKHLAESMGGAVGVRARSPRGSIFWVELAKGSPSDGGPPAPG